MDISTVNAPSSALSPKGRPERTGSCRPHSASLCARIGFEIEVGSARVHPFAPKGTILAEGAGWTMETDRLPPNESADLEFVLAPCTRLSEVERAASDILHVVARLRERALGSASGLVALADLDRGDARFTVRAEARSFWIEVRDLHFPARLQATYGIGLPRIAEYLAHRLPATQATTVLAGTHFVEAHYRRLSGQSLSERARGFVHLMIYYLACAQRRAPGKVATVHVNFALYMRSDFCAVFDKLLDASDRAAIAALLLPGAAGRLPVLMETLGMRDDQPVFAAAYYTQQWVRHAGPTVQAWLHSIIDGREDGSLRKDLLSPPPGYRLAVADAEANYGGGGMGVDAVNQLALFEIRSTPRRTDLPLNRQTRLSMLREFDDARKFNPALRNDAPSLAGSDARHQLLGRYDAVYIACRKLIGVLARERTAQAIETAVARLRRRREALAEEIAFQRRDVASLSSSLASLEGWFESVGCGDMSKAAAAMPLVRRQLDAFERRLWTLESVDDDTQGAPSTPA